jgi:hypothetical protein
LPWRWALLGLFILAIVIAVFEMLGFGGLQDDSAQAASYLWLGLLRDTALLFLAVESLVFHRIALLAIRREVARMAPPGL